MPIRQIHFTGRKRLTADDVTILLRDESNPLAFDVSNLSLERHELPGNSLVRVEAYYRAQYSSFDLGTVEAAHLLQWQTLPEFDSSHGLRFRVKVISVSPATQGQLLAEGNGIMPVWASGGKDSLLPVVSSSELGHEVFRLIYEDGPILQINDRLSRWRTAAREPGFVSLVYPTVLRTILKNAMSQFGTDDVDNDSWPGMWFRFARALNRQPMPTEGDDNAAEEWIDAVVDAFCRRHRIVDQLGEAWNWNL